MSRIAKRLIFLLLTSFWMSMAGNLFSQERATILQCRVISDEGTIVGCVVMLPELGKWSVSDTDGIAQFSDISYGEWTVDALLVGYSCLTTKIIVDARGYAEIKLAEQSYQLDDVTVTAEAVSGSGTSSTIDRTALEHLQTVSIADALQLLPGQITQNPSLSEQSYLTIRETNTSHEANALGTALIVDNASISNDANMQRFSTAKSATDDVIGGGMGVDVRNISTDCIETIEVVRGVASAQYGNLTSGAVVVTTRAGVLPWEIALKVDPKLKSVAASKGVSFGNRGGAISANLDYALSLDDERSSTQKFRRITAQLAYNDNFSFGQSRIVVNAKLSGHTSKNRDDSDPDMSSREYIRTTDDEAAITLNAKLLVDKPWLSNANLTLFASLAHQTTKTSDEHISEMPTPYTTSMESGENVGAYYPIDYDEKSLVDGKPVNMQAKFSANWFQSNSLINNKVTVGGEWNAKGNEGDGKSGEYLPTGFRPRTFSDVPYMHDFAGYAEDKLRISLSRTTLELQAGLRVTGVSAKGYSFGAKTDPRLNANYEVPINSKTSLCFAAGWGIMRKLPTLTHLYPDPAYLDEISYSFMNDDFTVSQAIFTTLVVDDTRNYYLTLPKSTNGEFALTAKIGQMKFIGTFFNEKLRRGFAFNSSVAPMAMKVYDITTEVANYVDGELVLTDGTSVDYYNDTTFLTYNRPVNAIEVDKWGIEYTVDFGKIKTLNTQFVLDGAYYDIERRNNEPEAYYTSATINGTYRKYAALCVSSSSTNVTVSKRLNTNLRIIARVPKLGMVCTLKAQCVWIDRAQRKCLLDGQNMLEEYDGAYIVMPLALINTDGSIDYDIPEDLLSNAQTKDYVQKISATIIKEDKPKPYGMFDIRLTKEVGKAMQFSFYANNFTNSRPRRYYASSDSYVKQNTEIYFGCDMKIKF